MSFKDYLNQAWSDHEQKTNEVVESFARGEKLIESETEVAQLAHLATHVFGEHQGQWGNGVQFLEQLKSHRFSGETSELAINRHIAVLQLAGGKSADLSEFSASDQSRISAPLAALFLTQQNIEKSEEELRNSLSLANSIGSDRDPAWQTLAACSNNMAFSLEEVKDRSPSAEALMLFAAHTARDAWEKAGGWLEVERAEYRLAMSYLKAGQLEKASEHAKLCMEISEKNQASALELFFAMEVTALIERERGNQSGFSESVARMKELFQALPESDQAWCKASMLE